MNRPVPSDVAAEKAVLGACLIERDAVIAISGRLAAADFYLEKHGLVYQAILACANRREPPDLATVASELRRQERLDIIGGISALADLVTDVPAAVHVEHYARIVEQAAGRRRLIETGGSIAALGYDETTDLPTTFDAAEQALFQVTQRSIGGDLRSSSDLMSRLFAHVQSEAEPAVTTGLADLDRLIVGWRPSRLYVIAARPGMGKTGLGLSTIAACCRAGGRALLFSLEMDELEVAMRLASSLTGISAQAIEAKRLVGDEFQRLTDAAGVISCWDVQTSDIPGEHLAALKGKARRAHAEKPLSLIVLDYLQLAEGDGENRQQVVASIARGLKNLSRELQVPVVALSQLSRGVEQRASKVPQLSDLRESGEIEQAADVVMFIHREEVYDRETDQKGIAELHLAKNRNGPLGVVRCGFDGPTTTFRDLSTYRDLDGY